MKNKPDKPEKEVKKDSSEVTTDLGTMHRDVYELIYEGGNSEF